MIIDCISDLHGFLPELEGGDLLILAGDYTSNDRIAGWHKFFDWLDSQKYRKKIIVAGNHDNFCKNWAKAGEIDDAWYDQMYPGEKRPFDYLCDSSLEFEGFKIWGSPWTLNFYDQNPKCKAFGLLTEMQMKEKWDLIPDDIDILITHTPPKGILDNNFGCRELSTAVKRIKPKLHIFGHIHESFGKKRVEDTFYVNASYVDEDYEPVNYAVRIVL